MLGLSASRFLGQSHPWFTVFGWCASVAIVGISVMPASERPMTGAGSSLEHLAAFSIAGALFAVGNSVSSARLAGYAVVGCVLIEFFQVLVPTRHARSSDLLLNAAASLTAIGVVTGLRWIAKSTVRGCAEAENPRISLAGPTSRWLRMIKLFSRSSSKAEFRTRSAERDDFGDRGLLRPVATAIDHAIASLQSEKDGLAHRMDDALTRASITAGNDVYEHDTRDPVRTEALKGFEQELASARRRLSIVDGHLTNLKFVRAVFLSRFPKSE